MKKNLDYYGLFKSYSNWHKLLLTMKISAFLLFCCLVNIFAAPTYSQATKITLNLKDATIEDVLNKIEDISEFYFLFNQKLVNVTRKVNIEADKEPIVDILNDIFNDDIKFIVYDRQIILTPGDVTSLSEALQQLKITGTVTDKNGPIPGANVVVTGTTQGAMTDIDGKYSIEVPPGSRSLRFSFVGMVSQEITIGTLTQINVTLAESAIGLDEVVVIGYGTTKKATVTGSIVSVQGEKMLEAPVTNVSQSLVGRLPGLSSVQRSGEPGMDGSTILIRGVNTLGNNNPLIVVDGIPGRSLDRIDAQSIESITVLKDASAAIYGSQAANGVILVTTKRGELGKPKISLNFNQGYNQPTIIPKMCDAAQYATLLNEVDYYAGRSARNTPEQIELYRNGTDPWGYPNTDWYAEVMKPWSSQNNMNASMSGGTEGLKYLFSIGSKFQDGFYYNSATNYKQYDFRSNVDAKLSENVNLSFFVSGRMENANSATRTANTIFRMLNRADPRMHAFWPDGTPGEDIGEGDNPAIISTKDAGYNNSKNYVVNSNIKLEIKIPWVKGLSLTGNAGMDKSFLFGKLWQTPWYLYSWDKSSYDENHNPILKSGIKGYADARLTENMSDNQSLLLNGLVNYEKKIGSSNIKVLVGMESIEGKGNYFNAYRRYFISTALDQMNLGGDLEKTNGGAGSETARLNYFGRFNYNYMEKYLIEFLWRYDGSYIFPQKGRYGFFPGISAGWRLSEEEFWKDNFSFFDNFKIRASWGQTGNDRIDAYQYLSTYAFSSTYIFGGAENKTLYEARIPNNEITWEIANQADIGLDASFLNNKLSVVLDLYSNKRTDILAYRNASVPSSTGLTLPRENIGKVNNKGFEFSIGYSNQIQNFKYDISINSGYSRNKILFWDETPGIPDYQQSTGRTVGASLYYQAIGIFRDQAAIDAYPHWASARPGDVIFKDVNDDGKIDGLDRVRSEKNTLPRFTGGLNLVLGYRHFDLSILFQGSTGAIRYLDTESGDIGNYLEYDYTGRWTVDNIDASKPRTYNRDDVYWKSNQNTRYVLNADYLRLKTLEFGYTLPEAVNNRLGINNLRIYVSGYNLLTFSPGLHDYDPETVTSGIYGGNYMPQRVINGGITLNF